MNQGTEVLGVDGFVVHKIIGFSWDFDGRHEVGWYWKKSLSSGMKEEGIRIELFELSEYHVLNAVVRTNDFAVKSTSNSINFWPANLLKHI